MAQRERVRPGEIAVATWPRERASASCRNLPPKCFTLGRTARAVMADQFNGWKRKKGQKGGKEREREREREGER